LPSRGEDVELGCGRFATPRCNVTRFAGDDFTAQAELVAAEEGSDSPCELLTLPGGRLLTLERRPASKASSWNRKGAILLAVCALASVLAVIFKPRLQFVATSQEGNNLLQQALVTLWSNTCPAADPLVQELRKQHWPNFKKGKAPKVSKVIYINMKWDPVRREYMEHQLQNLSNVWRRNVSLVWERFEGIGANHLQKDKAYSEWQEKGFSKAPFPKVAGKWAVGGCAYSHYSSIRKVPSDSQELVMITEDDVEIDPDFPDMWEELWRWMPDDWDIIRVGWFGDHQNCSQVVNSYIDLAAWQHNHGGSCMYCGAQAYIVNPKSKQKVLDRFEKSRMTHADELLSAPTPPAEDPERVPPLKAFVAWPMLAKTHFGRSGFPAFQSDRIRGRQAVGSGASPAAKEPQEHWLPSTDAPTLTKNPYDIQRSTTTAVEDVPAHEEAAATSAGVRSQTHVDGARWKAAAATDEPRAAHKRGTGEVKKVGSQLDSAKREAAAAKKQTEIFEEAARQAEEAAKSAEERARLTLKRKAVKLAVAAAQQVEVKVREAQRDAAAQAQKESMEAEQAARKANREVTKRLKAAEGARKRAEEKAAEVERQAKEALREARDSGSKAEAWKRAEREAEAAEREASERANQSEDLERKAMREAEEAKEEREKIRQQASQVLKALDAAEDARKRAEAALAEETSARKEAEAARSKAEAKLAEKEQWAPKVPKLPALGTLPPLASLPTLAPVASALPGTLAPMPSVTAEPALGLPPLQGLPGLPTVVPQGSHWNEAQIKVKK